MSARPVPISERAASEGLRIASQITASPIVAEDDGTFQLDIGGTGPLAVLLPVDDVTGEIVDIVAWHEADPYRWWLRAKMADILGARAIAAADFRDAPVTLFETPEQWVSAGGKGACIVDWSCDPRAALVRAPSVRCVSDRLRKRLEGRIRECAAPRFAIMGPADVAA